MKKLISSYNISVIIKAMNLLGKKKRLYLICIFVFCGMEIVRNVLYTIGIQGVINSLSGTDWWLLFKYVMYIVACNAIWWIWTPIANYCTAVASKGAVQNLKCGLVDKIINMPMIEIDKRSKGDMLSTITNDIDNLSSLYDYYFNEICRTFLGGIAGIIIMLVLNWKFTIVVVTLGILSIRVSSHFNRKLESVGDELQNNLAVTNSDTYELIKGAKTLRVLKLQKYMQNKVSVSIAHEADTRTKGGRITTRMNAIIAMISSITYVLILIAGALFVYFKLLDWATVIAFMGLKDSTDMLFVEFGQFMANTQICIAGIKRIFNLMDSTHESQHIENVSILPLAIPLTVNSISFAYDDTPVLKDFSMMLQKNSLTVLSGKSGTGKSTLMKLCLGLYTPQRGELIFSGDEQLSLESIRSKTAYVPQEPMLFNGSIFDNIICGNTSATEADVINAAIMAGADEFISKLPLRYDTILIDDGKNLSGGQQQRIAIARALVKNAPILLLDEITSALDSETEAYVINTIKEISKMYTVLFITHKHNIADIADNVYMLYTP